MIDCKKALDKTKKIVNKTLFWSITTHVLSNNLVRASEVIYPAKNPFRLVFSKLNLFVKQNILLCADFSKKLLKQVE